MIRFFCLVSLIIAASSCRETTAGELICPVPQDAIVLFIRDAESGLPAANGALAIGAFLSSPGAKVVNVDTGRVGSDGVTVTLRGVPGTYDVTVQKSGYATWIAHDILVSEDPNLFCTPKKTDSISVSLERSGL